MKTRFLALILLGCGFCLGLAAQSRSFSISVITPEDYAPKRPVDDLLFRVQYSASIVKDSLNPEKSRVPETVMLEVGKKSTLFYSYTQYLSDSVLMEDSRKNASPDVMKEHARQYGSGTITYRLYKNYPEGKTTYLDKVASSCFLCEEKIELPRWTVLPDTLTVAGYLCTKATCHFKGRDYEAWFTTAIPRADGPWKLGGLPGLILKAVDTRQHYSFVCTGIEQSKTPASILINTDSYEPVSRKDLTKIYERFAADPVGFITSSSPGVTVNLADESGNRLKSPKHIAWNPIELPEK